MSAVDRKARESHRMPAVGDVLDGFRVERVVGSDPGGASLLETIDRDGTRLRLKLFGEPVEDGRALRRMLRLARLRASIEHPGIAPMRGAGEAEGRLYLLAGEVGDATLADRLHDGPLEPNEALRIVGQVADALDAAAGRSLLHRDLAPDTIVLEPGPPEQALLTDFGIGLPPTRSCELIATLDRHRYRSPEEVRGAPVERASNVYSLACILVECLTGAPPYRYDRPLLLLHAHLVEPPPRVSKLRTTFPPTLDDVVARGMAKDPRRRFSSAAELVRAAAASFGSEAAVPVERSTDRAPADERAARGGNGAAPGASVGARNAAPQSAAVAPNRTAGRGGGAANGHRARARAHGGGGRRRAQLRPAGRLRPSAVAVVGVALLASAVAGFTTGNDGATGDDGVASSAALARARADSLSRASYVRTVDRVVDQLRERRAAGRRRLRAARRPAAQAAEANRLAAAYRDAREALPQGSRRTFADARLAYLLGKTERAYSTLAAAASRRDRRSWESARRDALLFEGELEQRLATLTERV